MSLDPDNQKILDMMKAAGHPPVNELQPDEARKRLPRVPEGTSAISRGFRSRSRPSNILSVITFKTEATTPTAGRPAPSGEL